MRVFPGSFILLILVGFLVQPAVAQPTPAKTDSSKMYRDIEKFSKQRKSTKFLYRLFFKPVDVPAAVKSKIKKKPNRQKPYSEFEGKIIREIDIETLDPFGYSITDTVVTEQNILYKAGNKMHFKTQRMTIRNLMLIRKNEPFDSLLVKESERLIRSQRYVHEVLFYVTSAGKKSDSVDIFIRVLDIWSILPSGSISTSRITGDLADRNFLGLGHEFQNIYSHDYTNGINTFNTNYFIPNIRNTYINTTLHYGVDGYKNFNRSLAVDRPFYSPFAKWAAGALASSQFQKSTVKDSSLVDVPVSLRFSKQDYWAGIARQLFSGRTENDRATNLIWAIRYLRIRYFEKPPEQYDLSHSYSNEDFYLTGVGISTRKYVQDKYVFKFGVTEDVPVGKVYGITGGYQVKNNFEKFYLGLRYSFGNYHDWGYLSSNFEYGTYFRDSEAEQSVFLAGLIYFTELFEIGNWKFRQFVKPQLTLGINRLPSESVTINNENGLRGFNSALLTGTKKIVVTLQTQSYAPWNILGFRFGPYIISSFGMLGNTTSGFTKSHVFSQFSLGVLIKNEFLIVSTFEISVAFYPIIPGSGDNIFKINSNSTTDFGFSDFIIGKPGTVGYQ